MKVRSSLKPELLKKRFFQGTFISGLGMLLLLATGVFLPQHYLKILGIPIVIVGFFFIFIGIYAFKKLKNLELFPYVLENVDDFLCFRHKSKLIMKIPYSSIINLHYLENKMIYGMGLQIDKNKISSTTIYNYSYDFTIPYSFKNPPPMDIFFSYFTDISYKTLVISLHTLGH